MVFLILRTAFVCKCLSVLKHTFWLFEETQEHPEMLTLCVFLSFHGWSGCTCLMWVFDCLFYDSKTVKVKEVKKKAFSLAFWEFKQLLMWLLLEFLVCSLLGVLTKSPWASLVCIFGGAQVINAVIHSLQRFRVRNFNSEHFLFQKLFINWRQTPGHQKSGIITLIHCHDWTVSKELLKTTEERDQTYSWTNFGGSSGKVHFKHMSQMNYAPPS